MNLTNSNILNFFYFLFTTCLLIPVQSFPGKGRPPAGHGRRQQQQVVCEQYERYHKESGQCYPLNLQGPCGDQMMFTEDMRHKELGQCACQDHVGCQYWPFTFWEPENRCYPLFERGPCEENEWLVNHQNSDAQNLRLRHGKDRNSRHRSANNEAGQAKTIHGECQPRPQGCQTNLEPQKMFAHNGKCYESETQGFCSTDQERMYFTKGCAEPKCFTKPVTAEVCAAKNLGGGTIQLIIHATPVPPKQTSSEPNLAPPPPPPTKPIMPPPTLPEQSSPSPEFAVLPNMTRTLSKSSIPCSSKARLNPDGSCQVAVVF